MKKTLKERLKAYSISAGTIAAGIGAQAQVLYTDVEPDTTLDLINSNYGLDLNNDNTTDFEFQILSVYLATAGYTTSAQAVAALPLNSNSVAGLPYGSYPYALPAGDTIGPNLGFTNYSTNVLNGFVFYSGYYGGYTFPLGNWPTNIDRYLGLKLELNGQPHYGWARISIQGPSSMILRDYAIELSPNTPIIAGDTISIPFDTLSAASGITATDVADAGNGGDIEAFFTKAVDESEIQEYRVIAVKASQVAAFNLTTAESMVGSQYLGITPTGSDITTRLSQNALDSDGDPVTSNQPYRLFVYSVGENGYQGREAISEPSNEVTLITPISLPAVSNVQLSDINDLYDERDLEVSFNALSNESAVTAYHVIIAKTESAFSFTRQDAASLSANRYTSLMPNGSNRTTTIGAGKRDSDGNPIQAAIPYRAYIYAVPDGVNANQGSLSGVSNEIILNPPLGFNASTEKLNLKPFVQYNQLQINGLNSPAQVIMFDMQGRATIHRQMQPNESIDLSSLPAGAYVVQVEADSDLQRFKIVL